MEVKTYQHFIVLKILEDFRNYSLKSENLIKEVSTFAWSDLFRKYTVREKDLETILDILLRDKEPEVRFAHMLLRTHIKDENNDRKIQLKKRILTIYNNSKSVINKIGLIYDLLEFDDIADLKKNEFLDFIEKNREEYVKYEMEWYENEETLLSALKQRVTDKLNIFHNISSSKKWIYLYNISLIKDKTQEANSFINEYFHENNDDFLKRVKNITEKYLNKSSANIGYESFYKPSYELAELIIGNHLFNEVEILDLGCGNSPYLKKHDDFNFKVDCVDIIKQNFDDNRYCFYIEDANLYMQKKIKNYDFIILNASLHELWTGDKQEYLIHLIQKISNRLKNNGKCYIADYYYSDKVTKEEFSLYKKNLEAKIGHADDMIRFYNQSEILNALIMDKSIKLIEYKELKVSDMVERFFYGIVWQKL